MVGSANRDPRKFPNPNRFDVTRAQNQHVAFGHGVHFCMGAALARLEARVALTTLFEHLDAIRMVGTRWVPHRALNVYGAARLPLLFRGRRSELGTR